MRSINFFSREFIMLRNNEYSRKLIPAKISTTRAKKTSYYQKDFIIIHYKTEYFDDFISSSL